MEKGKMKSYDALVQLVGKVRRNLRMLHILAINPGTGGVGAWPWCSHSSGCVPVVRETATLCPVRCHCLEQLLQLPLLTGQLAWKSAPSPLPTASAFCSVEPEQLSAHSGSWPLDPLKKQTFPSWVSGWLRLYHVLRLLMVFCGL